MPIDIQPPDGRNKADLDLTNVEDGSVRMALLAAEVVAYLNGLASGDSYRVADLASLPGTVNATGETRFAEVYNDSVSTANNGRYFELNGSSTWTKVPGDVTGRVGSLEAFQAVAQPVLPIEEWHPGLVDLLLDANRRWLTQIWEDGTISLRLNNDSIPIVDRAHLATDVTTLLPVQDDYQDVLELWRDVNGRPLIYWRNNGKTVLLLDDGTVTAAMLGAGSVTIDKIPDGVLTRPKFAAALQAALPVDDDYTGVTELVRDPNGRPYYYTTSDGYFVARIASTELSRALKLEVDALKGWCWGEENLANTNLRLSRIKAGYSERCSIINMGDSWTDHPGRSGTPLSRLLQAEYGGAACGYFGLSYFLDNGGVSGCSDRSKAIGSADAAWTRGRTAAGGVYSPDSCDMSSATPGTWVEVNCITAQPSPKLFYRQRPGGGTLRWQVNSGSWTTVDTNGTDGFASVTLTIPFTAGAVIRIEVLDPSTNGVTLSGLDFSSATGATVHKWARSGSMASDFTTVLNKAYFQACVTALDPHLMTFMWGTNEQYYNATPATLAASILTLITWVKEVKPLCDFLIICPSQTQQETEGHTYGIRDYRDAGRNLAIANRAAFADLTQVFGEYDKFKYSADNSTLNLLDSSGIHPDLVRGAIVLASAVFKLITKRV